MKKVAADFMIEELLAAGWAVSFRTARGGCEVTISSLHRNTHEHHEASCVIAALRKVWMMKTKEERRV